MRRSAELNDQQGELFAAVPSSSAGEILVRRSITGGKQLSPKKQLLLYEFAEWEDFVTEWLGGLDQVYARVERSSGSNDRGVDVAAFKTSTGFDGPWDAFQCKHYGRALGPADAWVEILKLLCAVIDGEFGLPDKYEFVAPKGCGISLGRWLNSPSRLATEFLAALDKADSPLGKDLSVARLGEVRQFCQELDWNIFSSADMDEIVAVHSRTPHHVRRFGAPLPDRPPVGEHPAEIQDSEIRFVEQLMAVYSELQPGTVYSPDLAIADSASSGHFRRQREAFYSAEALRAFAADSILPGTYEGLQEDLYAGVIELHDGQFDSGMQRLTAVLQAATAVQVNANILLSVVRVMDRKGICHQLANDDRLLWCPND